MFFPGSRIKNRYRADAILGRGGMGEVWKCFDESLNRFVVLKIVTPELAKTRPQHTSIFIDEARIGASLVGHPNVVTVLDVLNEQVDNEPLLAIVMEYVEGLSCSDWIDRSVASIDATTKHYISLQIASDICKALSYAHRHAILHRDIKPLNVFVSKYGITKIGDFGIARYADAVTREHTVWNFRSPAYSAPEQWNDKKPGMSTDIYQLGCTLYHLFTGKLPFEASSVAALIQKHLTAIPADPRSINPLLSTELSALLVECLAKKEDDRPGLWQVLDAITKILQKRYRLRITADSKDVALIEKISDITEVDQAELKSNASISIAYEDYNEAISESIELTLLGQVTVKLEVVEGAKA